MSSLLLRLVFAISIAAAALPANVDGQQANGISDNAAQSNSAQENRRSQRFSDFGREPLRHDFNTSRREVSNARIRMTAGDGLTNIRQMPERPLRNADQSHQIAPPIRLAAYEADLSPNLDQIELNQPPRGSDQEDLSDDRNDLSGIRQALGAYRAQPDLVVPASSDSQVHAEIPAFNVANQQDVSTDQGQLQEPATAESKLQALGFSVSDGSRKLVERIAYNMLFVLTLGIGFIVVAKKWKKFGGVQIKQSESEFEVLNTLNLPGKSSLMLIKVNNDRLLVAIDPTGVKSLVHLTDSFTESLDDYDDVAEQTPVNQLQAARSFADHLEHELPAKSPEIRRQVQPETRTPRRENTAAKNTEAIQKQMEAALKKFGLKGLV